MVMAGASATMMASALLRHGIEYLSEVKTQLQSWMNENGYGSIRQMHGAMSQQKCADPGDFERAHYVRAVSHYKAVGMSGKDELGRTSA